MEDIQKPVPLENEVLVKVHAVAVNPLDWHIMRGAPYFARVSVGLFKPKFHVLGADISGVVESTGKNLSRFKPGDGVLGNVFSSGLGGLAEYVCTAEKNLVSKPVNISFAEAAAVPVAALTALTALRDTGKVQSGQHVLVNGSSGGVGTYTVQLAKYYGAHVTGVCSTGNLELVRSIGADEVIDYTTGHIRQNRTKYDLLIDNVGNLSVKDMVSLMTPFGLAAVVGFTKMSLMLQVSIMGGRRIKLVNVKATQDDMIFLKDLLEAEKIKPVIDRMYSLADTPKAIEYLEKGHAKGKVVINVSH